MLCGEAASKSAEDCSVGMMTDQQAISQSSFSPSIFVKVTSSVLIIAVISGFSLFSVSIIGNNGGTNSISDIVFAEILFGIVAFFLVIFLYQIAFVRIQINASTVVYQGVFGVRKFSIENLDLVEIRYSKNGPDLWVRSGRRFFTLLGLGFSEKSLLEIQGGILRAGAEMSKTIATQRPPITDKAAFGAMYFYVLFVVFGGLGLILYLVYRAKLGHP